MLHPIRWPARSIVNALIVVTSLLGSSSLAAEPTPTPDEAHTRLTAVSRGESYVFAATPDGLFRASLETKRWERLKTLPGMPLGGTFARMPERSRPVIYNTNRPSLDRSPRAGLPHGLYLSRDDGLTWELIAERDDLGAVLLLPRGDLFAVKQVRPMSAGDRLLRSTDMGKTWLDITGLDRAPGQFADLELDPNPPGLVRVRGDDMWHGPFMLVADDQNYRWKVHYGPDFDLRQSSDEFFERISGTSTAAYTYPATMANYFRYDFGKRTAVDAFEVVPAESWFEFARGARVLIPVRVVFHYDAETALAQWRKAEAGGHPSPKPAPPSQRFADDPGGIAFWGLSVESARGRVVKEPNQSRRMGAIQVDTPEGRAAADRPIPAAVPYRVFDLSPATPYGRDLDLGRLYDFSQPGEYRVQIAYDTAGNTDADRTVWGGAFNGPVFTVRIRE